MRRRLVLVLAGLASVLACSKAGNVVVPSPEEIVVVRDVQTFRAGGEFITVDFENLPTHASSCSRDPFEPVIDNPLALDGLVFADPYCLSTGFCSSPTCPEANIALALNQGGTVALNAPNRGVLVEIEGMGDVSFALVVRDRRGKTVTVEETGIPFGTLAIGFKSSHGIAQIAVARVGPTPPDCLQAPCGPLVLSRLAYATSP
jgi:hypothetical protein